MSHLFDLKSVPAPHIFAVPPGRPFFRDLVAALLSHFAGRVEELPDVSVYVPSRRAVRSLKESFAALSPGGVVLLPRIVAVADLAEDDTLTDSLERVAEPLPDAPAAPIKRLRLAGIYREAVAKLGRPVPPWPTALRAAKELSRTADQLAEYDIDAEALGALSEAPEIAESARHWSEVLELLSIASEAWPRWLAEEGLLDARVRRAKLLDQLSTRLEEESRGLTVAAGFLGTSPSSQDFLRRIASLENGVVVLPALDRDLSDDEWDKIEAPHSQSAYKALLADVFGVDRGRVAEIPPSTEDHGRERRRLLSLALMPTEATDGWVDQFREFKDRDAGARALRGLSVAVSSTPEEEADFIALSLRETLEFPGKTAFLVTADRILGRRVAAKLRGWGIEIDDSGGAPLSGSYRATFLRSVARVMAQPSDPVALASLIHHQLFGVGMAPAERRPLVQALDRFLRGRAPRAGWDGLFQSFDDVWRRFPSRDREKAESLLQRMRTIFEDAMRDTGSSIERLLTAHLGIAEALAATPQEDGRARLYRFEDGEELEPLFASLLSRPELLGETTLGEYPEVFDALLEGPAVRPPGGQHPRLSIFGVLEARLQTADLVIVGGLQEGVWPGDAAVDPFLSRNIRTRLGMPSPDAEIGRVAHDFLDFAAAPHVMLTRAERAGRSPARASRLMLRLESFLGELDKTRAFDIADRLRDWRQARYGAEGPAQPAPRPHPRPINRDKAAQLSISKVGTWLRDPYAIYADKILSLSVLKPYDEPFGASHRGEILHGILENVVRLQMEEGREADLDDLWERVAPTVTEHFDMPRSQNILGGKFLSKRKDNFLAFETKMRELADYVAVEADGRLALAIEGREVTITGRADRIDRHPEGLFIIDYKSGGQAATVLEDKLFSPQLFITAMMAERGGLTDVPAEKVWRMSFVKLNAVHDPGKKKGKDTTFGPDLTADLKDFEERLTVFLRDGFDSKTPFTSQLHPFKSDELGDYDDLARRLEWMREDADNE